MTCTFFACSKYSLWRRGGAVTLSPWFLRLLCNNNSASTYLQFKVLVTFTVLNNIQTLYLVHTVIETSIIDPLLHTHGRAHIHTKFITHKWSVCCCHVVVVSTFSYLTTEQLTAHALGPRRRRACVMCVALVLRDCVTLVLMDWVTKPLYIVLNTLWACSGCEFACRNDCYVSVVVSISRTLQCLNSLL